MRYSAGIKYVGHMENVRLRIDGQLCKTPDHEKGTYLALAQLMRFASDRP